MTDTERFRALTDLANEMLKTASHERLANAQALEHDGRSLRLTPGMQVSAEVHRGTRSAIEYLLSPVQKAWHEAARER